MYVLVVYVEDFQSLKYNVYHSMMSHKMDFKAIIKVQTAESDQESTYAMQSGHTHSECLYKPVIYNFVTWADR